MKIIQMMGPNHPKGGEWALEIALGAARLRVRISGTVVSLLSSSVCGVLLSPSALALGRGRHQRCFCYSVQLKNVFVVIK